MPIPLIRRPTYLLFLLLLSSPLAAAEEEFMLGFRHPAVGGHYVNALYDSSTGKVFLPLTELLGLLQIPYERGEADCALQGRCPATREHWEVNLHDQSVRKGKEVFELTVDQYRLKDFDWFLLPEVFAQTFGLHFTINMTVFRMSLQNDYPLPAEERQRREQMRRSLDHMQMREDHPLIYPRDRQFAGAGVLDYNLSAGITPDKLFHAYSLIGGMEVLGGDIQGSLTGSYSEAGHSTRSGNIHWRFVPDENPYLTAVRAGQITTTGLQTRRIIGGGITNDPVMPRRSFETFTIDGTTNPDSEVELYVNNSLAGFTVADEMGYFHFDYPLNYGTALMSLRIYKPTGEVIIREQRMQIPFTFLPAGVTSYNIQGGYADNGMGNPDNISMIWHGDLAYGLTPAMTLKAGADYTREDDDLFCYASMSARLFRQYLLNVDAAPGFFYRASTSVNLPGSRSFNLVITHFDGDSPYNTRNANQHLKANFYLPFKLFGVNIGLRMGGKHYLLSESYATTCRTDLSLRIGQINLRMNYRGQLAGNFNPELLLKGLLSTSATYSFGRGRNVPGAVRGTRVRVQGRYNPRRRDLIDVSLQLTRNLGRRGRFTLDADHNLMGNQTMLRLGVVIDMQAIRSNTQATGRGSNHSVQQTLSGSVGLDAPNRRIVASNRKQVGLAAASVVAFVDSNNSGQFDPGEEIVPLRNINISGGSIRHTGNDGIMRISQLQSYWRYNVELQQSAIPNPTLAPLFSDFSFVADPNRYKRLEIPLYRTGIIEGHVKIRNEDGSQQEMGGVRLLLTNRDNKKNKQIRTFSDGSFYDMHLMPGRYALEVDPSVLEFIGTESEPVKRRFTVRALNDGHFIDGLDFLLFPADLKPYQKLLITMTEEEQQYYQEKLNDVTRHFRFFSQAQEAFYDFNFYHALFLTESALDIYDTDYALALKGSILYVLDEPGKARQIWQEASSRNPGIEIPKPDND